MQVKVAGSCFRTAVAQVGKKAYRVSAMERPTVLRMETAKKIFPSCRQE